MTRYESLQRFFEEMERIHFVFGIPQFPDTLENAPIGVAYE